MKIYLLALHTSDNGTAAVRVENCEYSQTLSWMLKKYKRSMIAEAIKKNFDTEDFYYVLYKIDARGKPRYVDSK